MLKVKITETQKIEVLTDGEGTPFKEMIHTLIESCGCFEMGSDGILECTENDFYRMDRYFKHYIMDAKDAANLGLDWSGFEHMAIDYGMNDHALKQRQLFIVRRAFSQLLEDVGMKSDEEAMIQAVVDGQLSADLNAGVATLHTETKQKEVNLIK